MDHRISELTETILNMGAEATQGITSDDYRARAHAAVKGLVSKPQGILALMALAVPGADADRMAQLGEGSLMLLLVMLEAELVAWATETERLRARVQDLEREVAGATPDEQVDLAALGVGSG